MGSVRSFIDISQTIICKAKSQDGTMFDVSLLDDFYKFEIKDSQNDDNVFEVSDKVKHAYYVFIKDFCPMVSTHWRKYLGKLCKSRETATFHNQLTRSDEAFAYWLMKCLKKKVETDNQFIKENGLKKWTEERKKGKGGKHDSNVRFDEYVKVFQKIDQLRNNQKAYSFWMNMFFDKFFDDYGTKSVQKDSQTIVRGEASNKSVEVRNDFD